MFHCRCVYKGRDHKLFLYAATNIRKGEKLFHSWTKNLLETQTIERLKLLREIFLQCRCERCSDPSELGTNIRLSISKAFFFNFFPSVQLFVKSVMEWCCQKIVDIIKPVGNVLAVILSILQTLLQLF